MLNIYWFEKIILAQATSQSAPNMWLNLVPYALIFVVIYFLMIRPASKQRREHQTFMHALKKDDEVITNGGVYGRVSSIEENIVTLEIADKVKIRILKDRISGRWNPVPLKATK